MQTPITKSMEMKYVKEVKDGKEIMETRRYRNLKVDARDEDILAVAEAISQMSESPCKEVLVTVQSRLTGGNI